MYIYICTYTYICICKNDFNAAIDDQLQCIFVIHCI